MRKTKAKIADIKDNIQNSLKSKYTSTIIKIIHIAIKHNQKVQLFNNVFMKFIFLLLLTNKNYNLMLFSSQVCIFFTL